MAAKVSECGICTFDYTEAGAHVPEGIPCGHTFCHECVEALLQAKKNCPMGCEKPLLSAAKNFALIKLLFPDPSEEKEEKKEGASAAPGPAAAAARVDRAARPQLRSRVSAADRAFLDAYEKEVRAADRSGLSDEEFMKQYYAPDREAARVPARQPASVPAFPEVSCAAAAPAPRAAVSRPVPRRDRQSIPGFYDDGAIQPLGTDIVGLFDHRGLQVVFRETTLRCDAEGPNNFLVIGTRRAEGGGLEDVPLLFHSSATRVDLTCMKMGPGQITTREKGETHDFQWGKRAGRGPACSAQEAVDEALEFLAGPSAFFQLFQSARHPLAYPAEAQTPPHPSYTLVKDKWIGGERADLKDDEYIRAAEQKLASEPPNSCVFTRSKQPRQFVNPSEEPRFFKLVIKVANEKYYTRIIGYFKGGRCGVYFNEDERRPCLELLKAEEGTPSSLAARSQTIVENLERRGLLQKLFEHIPPRETGNDTRA